MILSLFVQPLLDMITRMIEQIASFFHTWTPNVSF